MDLAKKITGPLEEALTVAFSQVQPSPREAKGVPRDRVIHTHTHKSVSKVWMDLCPGLFLLLALANHWTSSSEAIFCM